MRRPAGIVSGYRNLGFGVPSFAFEARDAVLRDAVSGLHGALGAGTQSVDAGIYGPQHRVSSGYTDFGARNPLGGRTQATIQLAFSADNFTQVAGLINQRQAYATNNTFSIGLGYVSAGFLYFDIGGASGTSTGDIGYPFPTSAFATGRLINLVFCVDTLAGSSGKIIAFANGEPLLKAGLATRDNAVSAMFSSTQPLLLGRVNNSGTLYFAGSIFCARVWPEKAPLTVAQDMSADPLLAIRPRRIWVPQAAITGAPTLSAAEIAAYTSTTARPRVTLTF